MPANFSLRTRTTTFTNDADGDGFADPGDVLHHVVVFENTGDEAFDVSVSDLLNGSTLVPGSVKIGPMAVDDLATITGNTPKTFTFAELLGNDLDPDGSAANLTISAVSNAQNGTVTINTIAQTVTFTPDTGYLGAASFEYTVTDPQGLSNVSGYEGTVDITVDSLVWYVDSAAAPGGDGSFNNPFTTLANLNDDGTAGVGRVGTNDGIVGNQDVDGAGDTIFIYDRGANAYTGGITLETGQKLFGDAHSFVVNGITIGATATNSTINHSGADTGYGITLSTGNEIRGLTIDGDSNDSVGIRDGNGTVGNLHISNSTISGSGKAVDIDQGGTLDVTLASLSSGSSTTEGVHLAGTAAQAITGTFTANGGIIQTATGHGFLVGTAGGVPPSTGGNVNITYAGQLSNNGGGATNAIEIQDRTGGTVTFSNQVVEGAGPGIVVDGSAGTVNFSGRVFINSGASNAVTLNNNTGTINFNPTGDGLDLITSSGTALTFTGGGTLNITGANNSIESATGQLVNALNGTVGGSGIALGALSQTGAATNAVVMNNLDGGNVTVASLSVTNVTGDGLAISNSNSTFTFANAVTIGATGAGRGIHLDNNDGGTVAFTGGGTGVDITSANGVGFTAINGGTVTLSGAGNTVNSTGAQAVNVSDTTIGGAGMTWLSVSSSGGGTGIYLSNAGSGGFTITGTGTTAASGGTITNKFGADNLLVSGIGIYINNTDNISLSNMAFTGTIENWAIRGNDVTNFTLANSSTAGSMGNSVAATIDEGAILFQNLDGTATFTGVVLNGAYADVLKIVNGAGSLNFTLNDSAATQAVIGLNNLSQGNDGVQIETAGTASVTANITGVTFNGARGDDINFNALGSSTQNITISNNTMINGHGDLAPGGTGVALTGGGVGSNYNVTYNISGNTIRNHEGPDIFVSHGGRAGTIRGVILNNTLGLANGSYTDGGQGGNVGGITIRNERLPGEPAGNITHAVRIEGNTIRDVDGEGIFIRARNEGNGATGSVRVEATILNNTLSEFGPLTLAGMYFQVAGADQNANLGVDVRNNTVNMNGADPSGNTGIIFDETGVDSFGADFYIPGYTTDNGAGLDAFLDSDVAGRRNTIDGGVGFIQDVIDDTNEVIGQAFVLPVPSMLGPQTPEAWEAALRARQEAALQEQLAQQSGGKTPGHAGELPPPSDDDGGTGGTSDPAHPVVVNDGVLSQAELDYFVEAAIQRWIAAGASEAQVAAMRAATIGVADMTGVYLGTSEGSDILIDSDGAGVGWFLDLTPGADEEYQGSGTRLTAQDGPAAGRIDLLTVLMHELGHQAGLSDHYLAAERDDLMYGYTVAGERRIPEDGQLDGATPGSVTNTAFALGPINIGYVPGDNAVQVQYDSTVNAFTANRLVASLRNAADISYRNAPLDAPITQSTNAEVTAVDTLTLGNRVFNDLDADGFYDAGEGISGVTLTLFADTNGNNVYDDGVDEAVSYIDTNANGVFDPAVDIPAAAGAPGAIALTVTTGADGIYSFANLAQGNYIVRVDAANFGAGNPLEGMISLAGGVDPDNNADNDDNGTLAFGGAIFSGAITLSYNNEPTAGPGNDTNDTLDLGFAEVNDAPVNTVGATVNISEDAVNVILSDTASPMSVSDPDAPGDIQYSLGVGNGILTIRTDVVGGITAAQIVSGANNSGTIVIQATIAQINATLAAANALLYTPNANFNGTDTLSVYTNDLGQTGVDPNPASVISPAVGAVSEEDFDQRTINIAAVDDLATPQNDSAAVDEDDTVIINVLANDTDVDNTPAIAKIDGMAISSGGTVTLASGAIVTLNGNGTLTYDPNDRFNYLISAATAAATGAVNDDATETFTYELADGTTATVTVDVNGVDSPGDRLQGDAGANTITGTSAGDIIDLSQGGDDTADGAGGNDGFYMGSALSAGDVLDGEGGTNDQLILQGNVTATILQNHLEDIEVISLLSGGETRFGDTANNLYDYSITMTDAAVDPGERLKIWAAGLLAGEDLFFDGSAETDGHFTIFAGMGTDHLIGGHGNDYFYFGENRFGAGDRVVGNGGTQDQLGLRGDYTVVFQSNSLSGIDTIVLISGSDSYYGTPAGPFAYDITMHDDNLVDGETMSIWAINLQPTESVTFDGSAEVGGKFNIYGGHCHDFLIGGGGDDMIWGNVGGDMLIGGGGNDRFVYRSVLESDTNASVQDYIMDFTVGDLIDLSFIDADPATAGKQDFAFISSAAFSNTAGELRVENIGGDDWIIEADIDGDGFADLGIMLTTSDGDPLTGGDFVL